MIITIIIFNKIIIIIITVTTCRAAWEAWAGKRNCGTPGLSFRTTHCTRSPGCRGGFSSEIIFAFTFIVSKWINYHNCHHYIHLPLWQICKNIEWPAQVEQGVWQGAQQTGAHRRHHVHHACTISNTTHHVLILLCPGAKGGETRGRRQKHWFYSCGSSWTYNCRGCQVPIALFGNSSTIKVIL